MGLRQWMLGGLAGLGALGAAGGVALSPKPVPAPQARDLSGVEIGDPDAWLAARVTQSREAGVWEQALERIDRQRPGKAPEAILFLHGFGATRAEGEATLEPIAKERGANVYYARLPGHGMTMDAHAAVKPADYRAGVVEALAVARTLGTKVTVVGASTGALLGTWLAATYPDQVDALVVVSPFYAFKDPTASPLLGSRAAPLLARLILGEIRDATWEEDPRHVEGYNDRWLVYQRPQALVELERLRRSTAVPETFAAVSAPVLEMVYYKDEDNQDEVVSVAAADAAYAQMNGGTPRPQSRQVRITYGSHILTSAWAKSDKDAVIGGISSFLTDVYGPPALSPPAQPVGEPAAAAD